MSAVAVFHEEHAAHLREALQAHDAGLPVFLGNPRWSAPDLAEAARQIPRGTIVRGLALEPRGLGTCDWPANWRGRVMIPTGGTGGKVKFVIHSPDTLRAAALGLRDALVARGLSPTLHGVTCTPPWHVSGFMPAIRARVTGGQHAVIEGRFAPDAALPSPALPADGTKIISLVPAQLTRLLAHGEGEGWLRAFDVILLGGSSVPAPLLAALRARRLPVFLTYGSTETGGGVVYDSRALPGVNVRIVEGEIHVSSPTLFSRYLGDDVSPFVDGWFATGDMGALVDGHLEVLGRASDMIISGGENIWPGRIEHVVRTIEGVTDACVIAQPDPEWGESAWLYLETSREVSPEEVRDAIRSSLPTYYTPRRMTCVAHLPRLSNGKVDKVALTTLA